MCMLGVFIYIHMHKNLIKKVNNNNNKNEREQNKKKIRCLLGCISIFQSEKFTDSGRITTIINSISSTSENNLY